MLRLPPTKIGIDSRDIEWHNKRHQIRQEVRKKGQSVDVFGSPVKDQTKSLDGQKLAYRSRPLPIVSKVASNANSSDDNDLISKEPIPRGRLGKVFWNQVVADAGAPLGMLIQNIDKQPQVIGESGKSQDMIHSSRASIDDNYLQDCLDSSPQLKSRFSSSSDSPYEFGSSLKGLDEEIDMAEWTAQPSSPTEGSPLSLDENMLDPPEPSLPTEHYHDDRHFDGASDPNNQRYTNMYGLHDYMDEKTGSMAPHQAAYEQKFGRSSSSSKGLIDNPTSPELPLLKPLNIARRRSIALPRSSLYISQAAASSSPEKPSQELGSHFASDLVSQMSSEKRLRSRTLSQEAIDETSGLLSQPPRRRKKHNPNASSSPQDPAESSPLVGNLLPTSAMNKYKSNSTYLPTGSPGRPIATSYGTIAPWPNSVSSYSEDLSAQADDSAAHELDSDRSSSSNSNRTSRRLFSGSDVPTTDLPIHLTPPNVLVSPSNILIPSSPPSPPSSPPQQSYRYSFTPPPPNRMTIYEDNLPASDQPQTPTTVSRRRRQTRSTNNPFGHGMAYTAPAGREPDPPAQRRRLPAETPTRAPRRLLPRVHHNQENLTSDAETLRIFDAYVRGLEEARDRP